MGMYVQGDLTGIEPFQPAMGLAGQWGTVGGFALREALSRRSLDGVMDVLDGLPSAQVAGLLREVGFAVSEAAVEQGRNAVLAYVERDLIEAVNRGVDGFDARVDRTEPAIAAPETEHEARFKGFPGDHAALLAVQKVLATPGVQIDLFGEQLPAERRALQFIAGQALEQGIQGFAFDGLPGKYHVGFGLQEVLDLHAAASAAIALEAVGHAVDVWRKGGHVGELPDIVPGSIQRILQSSPSVERARGLVRSIEDGSIAMYAREVGSVSVERVLAAQGVDVNAPTVFKQAEELNLAVASPNTQRGSYVGPVVGLDHCSALIKFSRDQALVISFAELGEDMARPRVGQVARIDFNKGVLSCVVADRGLGGNGVVR